MRVFFVTLIVALSFTVSRPALADNVNKVQEQRFFESLGDVPLMPGLYEMPDESVVFDKPGGRIIESVAASENIDGGEIRAFYNQVLPQMGWLRTEPDVFVRQNESLTMNIGNRDGFGIVRFMIAPRL